MYTASSSYTSTKTGSYSIGGSTGGFIGKGEEDWERRLFHYNRVIYVFFFARTTLQRFVQQHRRTPRICCRRDTSFSRPSDPYPPVSCVRNTTHNNNNIGLRPRYCANATLRHSALQKTVVVVVSGQHTPLLRGKTAGTRPSGPFYARGGGFSERAAPS